MSKLFGINIPLLLGITEYVCLRPCEREREGDSVKLLQLHLNRIGEVHIVHLYDSLLWPG